MLRVGHLSVATSTGHPTSKLQRRSSRFTHLHADQAGVTAYKIHIALSMLWQHLQGHADDVHHSPGKQELLFPPS